VALARRAPGAYRPGVLDLGFRCPVCLFAAAIVVLAVAAGITLAFAPRDGSLWSRVGRYLFVVANVAIPFVGILDWLYNRDGNGPGAGW
jgi:hypothetical protein